MRTNYINITTLMYENVIINPSQHTNLGKKTKINNKETLENIDPNDVIFT